MSTSRLINRNVRGGSGRTSMRFEPEIWDALLEICHRESQDLHGLIRQLDTQRGAGGRTSAVRVFVLNYFRTAATERGHIAAGHGSHVEPRATA